MYRMETFVLGGADAGEREHASFNDKLFQLVVVQDRAIHNAAGEVDGRVPCHVGNASPQFITARSAFCFDLSNFQQGWVTVIQ